MLWGMFFVPMLMLRGQHRTHYMCQKRLVFLTATFNIWVRPDQRNLDEFIKNFKFLYDNGVKSNDTSYIMDHDWTNQKEFPELEIKNTILREVTKPNEIVSLASAGFHYINLDRDVMRDEICCYASWTPRNIVKKGNPIKLSLLANEHCWGGCPIMPEHYQYNSTRTGSEPQYFNSQISRVSCQRWDAYDAAHELKAANIPP